MEQATVAQAEPQGSAAGVQDTSAPASGDNGAATPASFGSLFKQHVLERAERNGVRVGVSSAATQSSAADEQPAPSSADASGPGASAGDADGRAPDAATTQRPLSRAERKALAQQKAAPQPESAPADPPADTSASEQADPVLARVERVEKSVTEGLQRLEGLLKSPSPAEADPSLDGESNAYREMFGDDDEFARRAQLALEPNSKTPLSYEEADELESWAKNRKARDFAATRVNRQYQSNFSAMVTAAAAEFGIEAEAISKPGTTFRDIFGAFVAKGEAKLAADLSAATERLAKLEAANRQLADENEAMTARLPASARPVLAGGASATSRAAAIADRARMSGRQLMHAGLAKASQGRRNRPAGR